MLKHTFVSLQQGGTGGLEGIRHKHPSSAAAIQGITPCCCAHQGARSFAAYNFCLSKLTQRCTGADPGANAFNAASYSFFESAPASAAEVLEELEPGKTSADAEVSGSEPVADEDEANLRPTWA